MIVAICARKSAEQNISDEAESVARQIAAGLEDIFRDAPKHLAGTLQARALPVDSAMWASVRASTLTILAPASLAARVADGSIEDFRGGLMPRKSLRVAKKRSFSRRTEQAG